MTTCLIIIAIVLAHTGVGQAGVPDQPWVAWFTLVFICIYIAAYAWSCKLPCLASQTVYADVPLVTHCNTATYPISRVSQLPICNLPICTHCKWGPPGLHAACRVRQLVLLCDSMQHDHCAIFHI